MKKVIWMTLLLVAAAGLEAGAAAKTGEAGARPAVQGGVQEYPNLEAPALTSDDLAALLGLRVVKGRLANIDGLRVGSYELFFRDQKGNVKSLGNGPVPYRAEGSDHGEMLIALAEEGGEFVITLIASDIHSSQTTRYRMKQPLKAGMLCSLQFRGKSGNSVDDLRNIVQIGDQEVFTFSWGDMPADAKTAAVILRAYAPEGATAQP